MKDKLKKYYEKKKKEGLIEKRYGGLEYSQAYSEASRLDSSTKERALELAMEPEKKIEKKEKHIKEILGIAACIVIIAAVAVGAFFINQKLKTERQEADEAAALKPESCVVQVNEIYIYGTHLNIKGTLPTEVETYKEYLGREDLEIDLVLYSGTEFISVPIDVDGLEFQISEDLNGGLYLDRIPKGQYVMLIRIGANSSMEESTAEDVEEEATEESTVYHIQKKKVDEAATSEALDEEEATDENPIYDVDGNYIEKKSNYKYIVLQNNTDYQETTYYTMSNVGNTIEIRNHTVDGVDVFTDDATESKVETTVEVGNSEETVESEETTEDVITPYTTMAMFVTTSTEEVYDIVIDPGRGGDEIGVTSLTKKYEKNTTLELALKIKSILESSGMKVALTRSKDEYVKVYGANGRISKAMETKAKYMLSLRVNSDGNGGIELYSALGNDYTLASTIVADVQKRTDIQSSIKSSYTVAENVFARNFSETDVAETIQENIEDGLTPYEPTTNSSYYYIIRETGGIVTGAYMDDRNKSVDYNPYADTNVGIETYLLYVGYADVKADNDIIDSNLDGFAQGIAEAFLEVFQN